MENNSTLSLETAISHATARGCKVVHVQADVAYESHQGVVTSKLTVSRTLPAGHYIVVETGSKLCLSPLQVDVAYSAPANILT